MKRILQNCTAIKNLILICGLLFIGGSAWADTSTTYYAALKAKLSSSSNGMGTVYAGTSNTEGTYGAESTSGNQSSTTKDEKKDFYAFAQANDGYSFTGWSTANGGDVVSTDNPYKVSVSCSSSTENSPTTTTVYANFVVNTAISVNFVPGSNGSYTVNGTKITSTPSQAITCEGAASLVATPASGYKFFGWYTSSDGGTTKNYFSYSASASYTFLSSATVYAEFISSTTAIFIRNNDASTRYKDLNVALSGMSSGHVRLYDNGTLPAGNYTIPNGVKLYIPRADGSTPKDDDVERSKAAVSAPSAYRTLTLANGANIIVNGSGNIELGAQIVGTGQNNTAASTGCNGAISGSYGLIVMNEGSTITLNGTSKLYAWGRITGDGRITANSGTTVYEMFQVTDWCGGSRAYACEAGKKTYKMFPFCQYYIQNIEVPLRLKNGASEKLMADIDGNTADDIPLVGANNSKSMFRMNSSDAYIEKSYDKVNDRQVYRTGGTASINDFSMSVVITISTTDFILPLTNNMTVYVESGTTTITTNAIVNADARVYIAEGATLEMASGKSLYVYDSADWLSGFVFSGKKIAPLRYSLPYATSNGTSSGTPIRTDAKIEDATILVNGTLDVKGNLYTSSGNAKIYSSGTGKVKFTNAVANTSTTVYHLNTISGSSWSASVATTYNTTMYPAKLQNGAAFKTTYGADFEYLATAGTAANTTITYANGHWGWMEIWKDYDGTVLKAINTVAKSTSGTAPSDPTRAGFTFNGWGTASEDDAKQEVTHTAQYIGSYDITYTSPSNGTYTIKVGDATPVSVNTTAESGKTITLAATPAMGYKLSAWSVKKTNGGAAVTVTNNTFTMPAEAVTVSATFAINQYDLIVLANNDTYGTVTGSGTYDYNSVRTITATPKSGFKFVKWNDNNTNASREVTVTADVTFTATFDYDIANYTVKHWQQNIYDNDYTEVASETKSGTIGAQTNAEAKTYTGFIAQPFNQQTIVVEGTTVVNIYYNRETYLIIWDVKLNGEQEAYKEETLRYGAMPSFPTPTKEQDNFYTYSFTGWTPNIAEVTANQTYEGTFDATARTYDVTWNNMDGTLIAKEVSKYTWGVQPTFKGSDPTYSDGDPTKVYKFRGWKYERTGVEYKNDAVLPGVAGDETYTAVYTQMTAPIDVENGDTKEIETNTTTPTTTVHEGGMLKVQAGKALTTTTFILEASANASGQIIEDGTIEAEHVYYDLKLNSPRRHWHAFGVPWAVDLAANPLTEVETGRTFVLGNDYDIIWYNTETRASSGPGAHCWEYVAHHDKKLTPGQGYMIAFTRDVQTVRFVKASGAPIIYNQEVTVSAEGEGNNQGINALANPMAYHATLNAGPAVGYVHDGGEIGSDGYEEYDIENKSYVVGKTVYIQVQSNTTVAIAQSNADPISKRYAPARRKVVTDKEYLSLNDYYRISISGATADGGSVYVLPEEDKEDKYVVGHDLAKFGMSTKKAQIWIRRYDANLGLHTIAPTNGEAEFPINLYAPTAGEYTIANAFSPDDEYTAYLTRDGEAIWNLSDSPYTMTFNKGTVNGYGIRLAKKAPQIATGVDEAVVDAKGETRKVLVNDKVFIIRGDQVYSVDGQLVK